MTLQPLKLIQVGAGEVCGPDGVCEQGDELRTDFGVDGMTCEHCVVAVTREVGAVPGVESVAVALVPGGRSTVTVASAAPVDVALVRAAVEEAGYVLAD